MTDLFETPELIPNEVQAVLDSWDCDGDEYNQCARLKDELEPLGYIFDWDLNGEPFNLRKVGEDA